MFYRIKDLLKVNHGMMNCSLLKLRGLPLSLPRIQNHLVFTVSKSQNDSVHHLANEESKALEIFG